MYTSHGNSRKQDSLASRVFFITISAMSLAIVFFGMQLVVVGPLKTRLESIQGQLDSSKKDMRKLVAERNQLWKTNDLLSGLEQQADTIKDIEASFVCIKNLRHHVEREAQATADAVAAFDSMAGLHKRIASERTHSKLALAQLDDLIALRKQVIETARDTETAMDSLDELGEVKEAIIDGTRDLADATKGLEDLSELKYKVLGESDGLDEANEGLSRFVAFKEALQDSESTEKASQQAAQLVVLRDTLAASDVDAAESNAKSLINLTDSLAAAKTEQANKSLSSLIGLQARIESQSDNVAQAVTTLEILDDFQREVDDHVRSIEGVRRTMLEIAMLESTVSRAARVLQPLIQLGNLRRLSDREVREAARTILDQRSTRISHNSAIVRSAEVPKPKNDDIADDLVPVPPEATN